MVSLPIHMMNDVKTPPTTAAAPNPTGQPCFPQQGQTEDMEYTADIVNHEQKNLDKA